MRPRVSVLLGGRRATWPQQGAFPPVRGPSSLASTTPFSGTRGGSVSEIMLHGVNTLMVHGNRGRERCVSMQVQDAAIEAYCAPSVQWDMSCTAPSHFRPSSLRPPLSTARSRGTPSQSTGFRQRYSASRHWGKYRPPPCTCTSPRSPSSHSAA